MIHNIPFAIAGQAKALQGQKGDWKVVEECLRTRDARAQRMLLVFENAEDTQGTPVAPQLMPLMQLSHILAPLHLQGMPARS